ncbi:MAG: EamA family transporter [Bacteroidetes bacterium]|nr:EamA family transporter [Bacteroidota bacterium]
MSTNKVSGLLVIIAFATVYVVWGSTYFFIQVADHDIPPMMLGAFRFVTAGVLLMGWCIFRGAGIGTWKQIKTAIISGLMLLLVGTGTVIWTEKWLPSSLVAVLISSSPFWFVLLDVPKWKENLTNRSIIIGLIFGFIGVSLMFSEKVAGAISSSGSMKDILGLFLLLIATISWAGGSLYSKYHGSGSTMVTSAWQMLSAGIAFVIGSLLLQEWKGFEWRSVSTGSWLSVIYLVIFGSLAAYSAFVWLMKVRSAAQVSTYAYVNPVIAVLLGVFFAGEHMTLMQLGGLVVILVSVLLINLAKYREDKRRMAAEKKSGFR